MNCAPTNFLYRKWAYKKPVLSVRGGCDKSTLTEGQDGLKMRVCYGPWYHLIWKWSVSKDADISHLSGTEQLVMRSMPCPVVTEGFRQELVTSFICQEMFVPHRGPRVCVSGPEGGIPYDVRCRTSTVSDSLLSAISMYSSLATICVMRYVKYTWERGKSQYTRNDNFLKPLALPCFLRYTVCV